MKTVKFSVNGGVGNLDLCSQAPIALAVIQLLGVSTQRDGLTVEDVINELAEVGVLQPGNNEKNAMSNLLHRLKRAGLVQNPDVRGGTRRYIRTTASVVLVV